MRKLVAIILMLTVPVTSYAAMQDMLNNMFMSNVTQAGAFQTQSRAGFVGGSVELRTPVKPITLASFDPPRFSAGCGGLDMYGGSFSFINANQLTALFRQIMANALGLMFQAAIKVIDPLIADLVNYFQDVVNGLNKLSSNTCAIAHKLTDSTFHPQSKTNAVQDEWSQFGATTGSFGDLFTGKYASPAQQSANAASAENTPAIANAGNKTWRALQRTRAADKLDFFPVSTKTEGTSDDDYKNEVIMSLLGTEIVSVAKNGIATTAVSGGLGNPTTTPTETPEIDTRILKLRDLVNDGLSTNSLTMYACQSSAALGSPGGNQFGTQGCPIVVPTSLAFAGTRAYIANMLYGDASQINASTIVSNAVAYHAGNPMTGSILDLLTTGNVAKLTANQWNFLKFMPGAIARIIIDAQSDPANFSTIFPYLEQYASIAMAVRVGEGIEQASRQAWSGVKDIPEPQVVADSMKELDAELRDLRAERTRLSDYVMKAYELAKAVRRDNQNIAAHS